MLKVFSGKIARDLSKNTTFENILKKMGHEDSYTRLELDFHKSNSSALFSRDYSLALDDVFFVLPEILSKYRKTKTYNQERIIDFSQKINSL